MNLFKLSLTNLKQSIKNYGVYIFSMVFSIAVFYNFTTLMYSKQFNSIDNMRTVSMAASMCALVLIFFFIFFISYSSKFFIEQRKKEFGIYTFMGLENKQIAFMFSIESLIIGIISMIIGITLGVFLNKIFLMILVKIANSKSVIEFEISTISIIQTSIIFCVILIIVSLKEYILLIKTDISKLINAKNTYQAETGKASSIIGISGLLLIIAAYTIIIAYKDLNIQFPIAIMITVIMTIVGTICLFKGFFTIFINRIIKNKKRLYSKTNIVSYNNITFRIKNNNKALAQVAILIACSLTCIIVAFCMNSLFSRGRDIEFPYSLYYISQDKKDEKLLKSAVNLSHENVAFETDIDLIPYKTNISEYIEDVYMVKYSDVKNVLKNKDVKYENKIVKNKPDKGESILLLPINLINAFKIEKNVDINSKSIKINESIPLSILGTSTDNSVLILNDDDYESLKNTLNAKELKFKGLTLNNYDNSEQIAKYMRENSKSEIYSVDTFDEDAYASINGVYFIGCFLALVFTVSLGSIMYFKCIQDGSVDKARFSILRKLGISQEYINKVIFKQIGIFFALPIIVGTIHSIVAGYAVNIFFNTDSLEAILISLSIFIVIYLVFYIISVKKYIKLTK